MMSRNPERLDRVEMFGRLWSKDLPGLPWVGLGWSRSTWVAEPKESDNGLRVVGRCCCCCSVC